MKIHVNSSFFVHAYRVIELYTLFFTLASQLLSPERF